MAVSNWFLYIGIFLCASGIGLVVGAIFIAYWGIKTLQESKCGNSSANINHYHADNDGTDVDDWRKHNNINEGVSRDYVSKETLEDSR